MTMVMTRVYILHATLATKFPGKNHPERSLLIPAPGGWFDFRPAGRKREKRMVQPPFRTLCLGGGSPDCCCGCRACSCCDSPTGSSSRCCSTTRHGLRGSNRTPLLLHSPFLNPSWPKSRLLNPKKSSNPCAEPTHCANFRFRQLSSVKLFFALKD